VTKWLGVVAGLALPAAGVGRADMGTAAPAGRGPDVVVCQTLPRSRASGALNDAIDSYRKGDYEAAAEGFKLAQAGSNDLTPVQRQDLAQFVGFNTAALQRRAEAADLVRQAEKAEREGKGTVAADLAQKALGNQYLPPVDKLKAQELLARVRGTTTTSAGGGAVAAKAKLTQARKLYAEGNLEAAEQLAREAERTGVVIGPGEESPRKLIDEIAHTRQDAGALLTLARAAVVRGDLERAETLARASKKVEPVYAVHLWGDSPAKVLDDVAAARAKKQAADKDMARKQGGDKEIAKMPPADKDGPRLPSADKDGPRPMLAEKDKPKGNLPAADMMKVPATVSKTDTLPSAPDAARAAQTADQARQLMRDGRKALREGQIDKADDCARKADALKPNLGWWEEDTPAKLLADVQAAKKSRTTAKATDPKAVDPKTVPADPKGLLHQAHEAFDAGKFEEATTLAQKAKIAPGASWGLFEFDTPDKLINEVNKARAKRNQEEAARLLAEGRKLLEQAQHDEAKKGELLDAAQKAAYKADTLRNGNYSAWEWGDRPSKLLADIDTERKKGRAKALPPVPPPGGTAVAANDGSGRWPAGPPDDANLRQARRMMNDARAAARAGNAAAATALIDNVERMNLPADKLGSDSPAAVRRELAVTAGKPAPTVTIGNPPPAAGTGNPLPPSPIVDRTPGNRGGYDRARALVAEARQLQAQGRLIEARNCLLEAQKLPANFGPEEDRPEKALLELAGLARRQIDKLETQGDEAAKRGSNPGDYAVAEEKLGQAQALARGFQLDTYVLDKKLAWVQQKRGGPVVAQRDPNEIQHVNATDGGPQNQGKQLLDQARLEIRNGNNSAARHLAEQVYAGPFALKTEAADMLRSIDVEEYEQRRLESQRTFEAANSAFKRRDYQIARSLLGTIDVKLLLPEQQEHMRQLMTVPEMQPDTAPSAVARADVPGAVVGTNTGGAATTNVSDTPSREADYLTQVQSMQQVQFQKLRFQELDREKEARKLAEAGDTERALEVLQEYLRQLPGSGLDPDKTALLRRPVEAKVQQYRTLDAQKKIKEASVAPGNQAKYLHGQKVLAEANKEQKIKELMDKYHTLYKQAKYQEAEMYASQAQELEPDNAAAAAAIQMARMQRNIVKYRKNKQNSEDAFVEYADDAENMGPIMSMGHALEFDKSLKGVLEGRLNKYNNKQINRLKSEKEREIESRLLMQMPISFTNVPLGKVLDDLANMHGINIVPDALVLQNEGVALDHPLTLHGDFSLKAALNLLLNQVNLTYTIENEALVVTTKEHAGGRLVLIPFQVTDLVIPIPDSNQPANPLPSGAAPLPPGGASPVTMPLAMSGGSNVGSPGGFASAPPAGSNWDVKKAVSQTKEDQLIQLIKNTIAPRSWADMGGQGTIDYFPMTMTLVINQTTDIQEQIGDLLAALRRLQDAEVAVEIRLISIAEGFFERIGVDFNINIVNNKGTQKFQPMITSGQFQPAGFINDFTPDKFLSGLTPAGTFTSDLGIPIRNSSFGMAIPPFGGFPNTPGGNGGIEMGLAFLSDIQVFMFLEAAQGDQRTNVMQAPKITLFNGQLATLTVSDQQFFVTSASVTVVNGSPVFIPNNQLFPTGTTISVQAVISADRRFVRLNFSGSGAGPGGITLTNLASATVPLFPIVQLVPTVLDGGVQTAPVAFTQFFQQPVFNTVSVVTTVAVPDGGTVLLGGLKRLSEGRNEFGPPVLSKIPYLDRLFRNVGYGREVQNLMMMVTPRIIINAEEEERQTGIGQEQRAAP